MDAYTMWLCEFDADLPLCLLCVAKLTVSIRLMIFFRPFEYLSSNFVDFFI